MNQAGIPARRRILITGTAGFIGFHLARRLLAEGCEVHGYDGMTVYDDMQLKRDRHTLLMAEPGFGATEALLEDDETLQRVAREFAPEVIVHLAAQAGVRFSIENPRAYIDSNLVGTFNVMEAARRLRASGTLTHLLMASTSSVYGVNEELPFTEIEKADNPLTIYAATKKANEAMAHSYAHLWNLPTTLFRFFTAYGPWGRPDMAPFRFADAIAHGRPIEIYNNGEMSRDFTFVTDLVHALRLLIDVPPQRPAGAAEIVPGDSLSPVAPYRIVNIGNSEKVNLLDFVAAIEQAMGVEALRNYLPMQPGDVVDTWADASLLMRLTGYKPKTDYREGVRQFVAWYREYYGR